MLRKSFLISCLLVGFSLILACGEGTPVAPVSATLSVSANPSQIGYGEVAVLSISANRSTGNPVNPGTEIQLTTTLGSVPAIVTTDERGLATANLTAGRQSGTATVTVASGATAPATVTIEIGSQPGSLNLTAKPTRLAFTGGTTRIRLFVLDDDGQPFTGASVFFSATAGRLNSQGVAKHTNPQGEAADTLRLSSDEAAAVAGSSVQVTARVVVAGGETSSQLEIPVDPLPTP